jgi:hypothetical protein
MKQIFVILLLGGIAGSVVAGQGQSTKRPSNSAPRLSRIQKLEELNWPQLHALERTRTLVLLPVGMVEEHGPHLPVGTDTLAVLYEVNGVSRRVSEALKDWSILVLPPINYGQGALTKSATCSCIPAPTAFASPR